MSSTCLTELRLSLNLPKPMAKIRDLLLSWLGGTPQAATTLTQPERWLVEALVGAASAAGVRVSPLGALGVPTVYACVNAVSRPISTVPVKLYRARLGGGRDVQYDNPLHSLLHDSPNDEITSSDFRCAVQANATLRNNGYALIVRNGFGQVVEMVPIPNKEIQPQRDADKNLFYLVNGERYEKEQILHIRGLTTNGVVGEDLVTVAREPIGLAIALQDYGARFFPNSTSPTAVVQFPQELSREKLDKFAAEFDKYNSGSANAHKRMILHGGATLGNAGQINNRDRQFIEAKQYQDKAICQVLGVPQIKAGITEDAHYATAEQENQSFINDSVLTWTVRWEQALNMRVLTRRQRELGFFFRFELDGLLRADVVARTTALEKQHQNGVVNRNEWRDIEDRNPVPGGDQFVMSQNVQMLDSTGKPVLTATETQSQQP